jgi:tetratricopeptide (TPR) repeat protein
VDALHGQGVLALQQLDLRTGTEALERALAMAVRLGDPDREARECNSLGVARRDAGDTRHALDLIERSLAIARRIGNPQRVATALSNFALIHIDLGDDAAAVVAARQAIAADEALDDPWGVMIDRCNLVMALLYSEGPEHAYEEARGIVADAVALGDIDLSVDVLETCATIWAGLGDAQRAATLLGTAEKQRELAGIPRAEPDERHLSRFMEPARRSVPEQTWADLLATGASMSVEEAAREAITDRSLPTPTPP